MGVSVCVSVSGCEWMSVCVSVCDWVSACVCMHVAHMLTHVHMCVQAERKQMGTLIVC